MTIKQVDINIILKSLMSLCLNEMPTMANMPSNIVIDPHTASLAKARMIRYVGVVPNESTPGKNSMRPHPKISRPKTNSMVCVGCVATICLISLKDSLTIYTYYTTLILLLRFAFLSRQRAL